MSKSQAKRIAEQSGITLAPLDAIVPHDAKVIVRVAPSTTHWYLMADPRAQERLAQGAPFAGIAAAGLGDEA